MNLKYIVKKISQHGFKKTMFKLASWVKLNYENGFLVFFRVYFWNCYNYFFLPFKNRKILYAFYDLRTSACDFSILIFLACASSECVKNKNSGFHLVFVPGDENGFRSSEKDPEQSLSGKQWRLHNILLCSAWLHPLCKGVTITNTRQEAQILRNKMAVNIFPKNYHTQLLNGNPYFHDRPFERYKTGHIVNLYNNGYRTQFIEPQSVAVDYVNSWIKSNINDKKLITISLRQSNYGTEANSSFSEWVRFVNSLDLTIYHPVFVVDQTVAMEPLPEELQKFDVMLAASFENHIRAALYHLSYLNLMVINGPSFLAIFNLHARCIVFNLTTSDPFYVNTVEGRPSSISGVDSSVKGERTEYGQTYQRLVYKEDTFAVISEEFKSMCKLIENNSS